MTTRPIRSEELLDLARSFVPLKAPPGRPRTAHLRRGISLAYYALFHELVEKATSALCGPALATAARRQEAARWFGHGDMRVLAEAATGGGGGVGRAVASVLDCPHPDLVRVAEALQIMQHARHRADYDHRFDLTRQEAVKIVRQAEEAVARVRRLWQDGDPSLLLFLRLMVGAVRIAKTRVP